MSRTSKITYASGVARGLVVISVSALWITGCAGQRSVADYETDNLQLTQQEAVGRRGFSARILPGSTGVSVEQLTLDVAQSAGHTTAAVSLGRYSDLSRLYLAIEFDETSYCPQSALPDGQFAGNPSCIYLAAANRPGELHYGQIIAGSQPRGLTGNGKVVTIRFAPASIAEGTDRGNWPLAKSSSSADLTVDDLYRNAAWNSISWSYLNPGDYDQNGEVAISDLTPLGLNFGATGPFAASSAQWVIDGDQNGEINFGDLTVIGQNFGKVVNGYQLYASPDGAGYPAAGEARLVASLNMQQAQGGTGDRKRFSYTDLEPLFDDRYWVVPSGHAAFSNMSAAWEKAWHIKLLHSVPIDGGYSTAGIALAVVGGRPCAAWAGGSDSAPLYCSTATDSIGDMWNEVTTVPTGLAYNGVSSVVDLGGRPGVVVTGDNALLFKAEDAEGTSWSGVVPIRNGQYYVRSSFVADGRLRFLISGSNKLFFYSGDSADPTSFGLPQLIGEVYGYSPFRQDDQLAICYQSLPSSIVHFRAYEVVGDTLNAFVSSTVDDTGTVSWIGGGTYFQGRPYLWYVKDSGGSLYQITSGDRQGEQWNNAQQIDFGPGTYGGMDVIEHYGVMFSMMMDLDEAGLVTLVNASGDVASWQTLSEIAQSESLPAKTRLQLVHGHPAIVFLDTTVNSLDYYYARFY